MSGKGDKRRPGSQKAYAENHEWIWGKSNRRHQRDDLSEAERDQQIQDAIQNELDDTVTIYSED